MELVKGRPQNEDGRLGKEIETYDLLDALQIPYERVDHEALNTMEACAEADQLLQCTICKNLFLCNRQKTKYYLLMMPGNKPFKTKELSAQINSARLSFASPEDMALLLNLSPGSVTVMGLMYDRGNRCSCLSMRMSWKESILAVTRVSIRLVSGFGLRMYLADFSRQCTMI